MKLSSIDLNILVALDALLTERSVTRAARRIGRSQPATSHSLNRARHLFNGPLLVRVRGELELTARARMIAPMPPPVRKGTTRFHRPGPTRLQT